MIYKYIQPSPVLQSFVRDYLVAHFVFDKADSIPIKPYAPKPEQGITFFPRGFVTIADIHSKVLKRAPKVSVFGQQLSRYNFHLTQEYMMFRVHFHPGKLFRLLGIPLVDLTDQYSDAAAIINGEVEMVNESLANCSDYMEMTRVVEAYLTNKIRQVKKDHLLIDDIATAMLAQPSRFSLDQLAHQGCLSPRQFNRKFKETIGVGPKYYSRIIRFYRAYKYSETHPKSDWSSISVLFGYTDYQHLVKDFKEFACVSPPLWTVEDNQSPERILRLV